MAEDEQAASIASRAVHTADVEVEAGPVRLRAHVSITTRGLLAIGLLTSGIILSVVPVVWVATTVPRRRPTLAALQRR